MKGVFVAAFSSAEGWWVMAKEHGPKVEMAPVDKLVPYARNARTHSDAQVAQIAASIKEFGFTNPVLTDGSNGIIAGHGRVLAARKLGMATVPTIALGHLTETQRRAYVLADNKLALNAGWDAELLALELKELEGADFDLALTGFDPDEVSRIVGTVVEGLTDPDDVPEAPAEPRTRLGDVWLCGKHRIVCGDSTRLDVVERACPNGAAMWLTDPPYNVGYEGGNNEKKRDAIHNDKMDEEAFGLFLSDACGAAMASLVAGGAFYVWHADAQGYLFRGAAMGAGLIIRQCLIWVKHRIMFGRQDYQWQHEPCLYGWKAGAAHVWLADRTQPTVMHFDRPARSEDHPTMKPVGLFEYLIGNSCPVGGVVLDTFGGSGTTMIACERAGRIAGLVELEPKYVDVTVKRWQAFTGKVATLESTGEPFEVATGAKV